ncbi:hypothetical protein [Qipengyuania flava]|uniref:hypothetical protein n=1 Tax=Qipengyuania flava TaxID=192812 RepID=UPI0012FDDD40|nr:hypothetical protein [Qipengyuania flava]
MTSKVDVCTPPPCETTRIVGLRMGRERSGLWFFHTASIHLSYAASTAWVDRAQTYLDRAANAALPEIVARAILLAEVEHNAGRTTSQETDHAE